MFSILISSIPPSLHPSIKYSFIHSFIHSFNRCASSTYVRIAKTLGLEDIRQDDWTRFVAPFWPAVIRSALVPRNFFRMLRSGRKTVAGAIASFWMLRGFNKVGPPYNVYTCLLFKLNRSLYPLYPYTCSFAVGAPLKLHSPLSIPLHTFLPT